MYSSVYDPSMKSPLLRSLKVALVILWSVLTLSLSGWWFYLGLSGYDLFIKLQASRSELVRFQRMFFWEGSFLLLLLLTGTAALAYYVWRESKQREERDQFFSTFTHELKTPIASLRLQAEMIREKITAPEIRERVDYILAETTRLTLQLENSLLLATGSERKLFLEAVAIPSLLESLQFSWPQLHITSTGEMVVRADTRALEVLFNNIFYNAVQHGHASTIDIAGQTTPNGKVVITIQDNGQGYTGNRKRLGTLFERHYSGSGSGIGLYLAKTLTAAMGGRVSFPESTHGFKVELLFNPA